MNELMSHLFHHLFNATDKRREKLCVDEMTNQPDVASETLLQPL